MSVKRLILERRSGHLPFVVRERTNLPLSSSNIVIPQQHNSLIPLCGNRWNKRWDRPYFQAGLPYDEQHFHLPGVAVAKPYPLRESFRSFLCIAAWSFMPQ